MHNYKHWQQKQSNASNDGNMAELNRMTEFGSIKRILFIYKVPYNISFLSHLIGQNLSAKQIYTQRGGGGKFAGEYCGSGRSKEHNDSGKQ